MRRLSILLTLALLACGCASGTGHRASGGGSGLSADGGASGAATAPGQAGGTTPQAGATGQGASAATAFPVGQSTPTRYPDLIVAKVNRFGDWGCSFQNGDRCEIPIQGEYWLHTQLYGNIVMAAYENGSSKPAVRQQLPVQAGQIPFQAKLLYKVGAAAKTVTFQGFLTSKDGKTLAYGSKNTFTVGESPS